MLGPATDGGWWALGVCDPATATVLAQVPMSRPDIGSLTRQALEASGVDVQLLPPLTEADEFDDLAVVASQFNADSHFRKSIAAIQDRR